MGKFPVRYMGSLSSGVCMGGLIPVIFNVTILGLDVDMQMAGFACFVFSGFVALLTVALFIKMERMKFYRFHTDTAETDQSNSSSII